MKVITVVGTRPEIIKLSCVIRLLDRNLEHILIHTGQNFDYELNKIFFDELEIRQPNYFLDIASNSVADSIGHVIIKIDEILQKEMPDATLILGDTNSGLSVIAAKRRKIPIFHMEAGNRCFDQRVPEEINRKIIDHTSDINLPYSSIAREYLLKEGFPSEQIIKVGSPMYEVLSYYKNKIDRSSILDKLKLTKNKYFVVSIHREENVDNINNLKKIISILSLIYKEYNLPIILSTHPRTRKRFQEYNLNIPDGVYDIKPLGFLDYIQLQKKSFCVISDSGTITEEASILNFPALTLREVHERPEGMEEATLIMTGLNQDIVLTSINVVTQSKKREVVQDYLSSNVSYKVLSIILSYTNYINRRIWHQ